MNIIPRKKKYSPLESSNESTAAPCHGPVFIKRGRILLAIGVRAGGARGAAAPPNFGQLRFFGQQEKIWAKPTFKDVSCFFMSILER